MLDFTIITNTNALMAAL